VKTWDRTCSHSIVGAVFLLAIVPRGAAQCEIVKLSVPEAEAREGFGASVAVCGEVALVGMPGDEHDDHGIGGVGSAFVFGRSDGRWQRVMQLTASDGVLGDVFGSSVAVQEGVAVVGAAWDDDVGSAYVFHFDGNDWIEEAKLMADDGHGNDWFGGAVAIDAGTIVVGAPWRGAAYVFEHGLDGTWSQVAKLLPSDPPYWEFGLAVAVSGNVIVVGSNNDDDLGNWSGSAYVFERSTDGTWERVAKLLGHDTRAFDNFGQSVAVNGDRILVGAPGADMAEPSTGAAYVFERQANGVWVEVAKLVASDGENSDWLGSAVALSADTALLGAPTEDDGALQAGAVYVFVQDTEWTWSELDKLTAADGEQEDRFGEVLGLDGNIALIGVWRDDDNGYNSGSAYVFAVGPDEDGDGVMDACECPGDLNHDWIVDFLDVLVLLEDWGCTGGDCPGDCDADGDTDQADLGLLLANWGNVCP